MSRKNIVISLALVCIVLGSWLLATTRDDGRSSPPVESTTATSRCPYLSEPSTLPIEELKVGDRVLAWNPEVSESSRSEYVEPNWNRWFRLRCEMLISDGPEKISKRLDIDLLRSEEWLTEHVRWFISERDEAEDSLEGTDSVVAALTDAGRRGPVRHFYRHASSRINEFLDRGFVVDGVYVDMDLPELGITGPAIVTKLEPFRDVDKGEGRVVTATFHHDASNVFDLFVEGDSGIAEAIGTTGNHPFWSVDRQEFVRAENLVAGEALRTWRGDLERVRSIVPRTGSEAVYNLEVHAEHVYYVGNDGLLVHNSKSYIKTLEIRYRKNRPKYKGMIRNNKILALDPTDNKFHYLARSNLDGEHALPKARVYAALKKAGIRVPKSGQSAKHGSATYRRIKGIVDSDDNLTPMLKSLNNEKNDLTALGWMDRHLRRLAAGKTSSKLNVDYMVGLGTTQKKMVRRVLAELTPRQQAIVARELADFTNQRADSIRRLAAQQGAY